MNAHEQSCGRMTMELCDTMIRKNGTLIKELEEKLTTAGAAGWCTISAKMLEDVVAELRKATELPRVLTWDELWGEGHPQTVWVEDPNFTNSFIEAHYDADGFPGVKLPIYITENRQYWFDNYESTRETYGRRTNGYYFRAWSKEPTERQRKAVKWND